MKKYLITFADPQDELLDEKLEFVLALAALEQDLSVVFKDGKPENKKINSFELFGIKILESDLYPNDLKIKMII